MYDPTFSPVFSALGRPVYNLAGMRVPLELWLIIIKLSLPDCHNHPVAYAKRRGAVALVCKEWGSLVYDNELFWSRISLNQNVKTEAIEFVLKRCPTADLHVRLTLLDIAPRGVSVEQTVSEHVTRLFNSVSSTSNRWASFFFYTENPDAYLQVQSLCVSLSASRLTNLSITYFFMEGYSIFNDGHPIYVAPFKPAYWFSGSAFYLRHLKSYGVALPRDSPHLFDNLVSFDVSQLEADGPLLIDWQFLSILFSSARQLRYLRLADLPPFEIPSTAVLHSTSLAVLDVCIEHSPFLVKLVSVMDVPSLSELTIRACYHTVADILSCRHILGQVKRVALHGSVGDGDWLYALFDSLSSVETLDLSFADYHSVQSYFSWTILKTNTSHAVPEHALRTFIAGFVPVKDLLRFVRIHGAQDGSDGSHMMLRSVQLGCKGSVRNTAEYQWICDHVSDVSDDVCIHSPIAFYILVAHVRQSIDTRSAIIKHTLHWVIHRLACVDLHDLGLTREDRALRRETKLLVRWLNVWRDAVLSWAVFAADLANGPLDFLATHTFVLEVRMREGFKRGSVVKLFEPVHYGLLPDSGVFDLLSQISDDVCRSHATNLFEDLIRRDDVVRLMVVCGDLYSSTGDKLDRLFAPGHLMRFTDPESESARDVSRSLGSMFAQQFVYSFESGDVYDDLPTGNMLGLKSSLSVPKEPFGSRWMLGLPVELLVEILLYVCGDYFDAASSFESERRSLLLACRGWSSVVYGNGRFWGSFTITSHMPSAEIEQWSNRVRATPLDLRLFLGTPSILPPGDERTSVVEAVDVFSLHSSRCHRIAIYAEEMFALPLILDGIAASPVDSLTSLRISRSRVITDPSTYSYEPVVGLFPFGLPSLGDLRLTDVVLAWSDMQQFHGLTVLVLHHLVGTLGPSYKELTGVLRASIRLLRLSLRCVEVGLAFEPELDVVLPGLQELDLLFNGDVGLARFVSTCVTPVVATLSVVLDMETDVEFLLRCPSILRNVVSFYASGFARGTGCMTEVYGQLRNVNVIDISGCTRSMFAPLLDVSAQGTDLLCPDLGELTLSDAEMSDIRR
ncbi:hypothetical protein DFH06DRAFT_1127894 [Mycena polygramma]|nr:hypothetical protein DFH06DRAFT_1127894 [Mycena polygramma]